MVSHHLAKFSDHRHCGSGDIMFLVVEGENSRCSRFNPQTQKKARMAIAKLFKFHANAKSCNIKVVT